MTDRPLKILHTVEFYSPSVGGMQEVVKQLSERLVQMGHEVTVATRFDPLRKDSVINGVHIKPFSITGNIFRGIVGDKQEYEAFLLESNFDVVVNFASHQWATDLALPLLSKIKGKKVFVTTWTNPSSYTRYVDKTSQWLKEYDSMVYLAEDEDDLTFAKQHHFNTIEVIPNGADEREFLQTPKIDIRKELDIPPHHKLILHVGSHTGQKGHAEAINIFKQANIPDSTLLIVGNTFSLRGCIIPCTIKHVTNAFFSNSSKQLKITSLPRNLTLAAYKEAALFLFPSNTEVLPIVLFECMASRLPFLATDVGLTKHIVEWSHSGKLLPTHKDATGRGYADVPGSVLMLQEMLANQTQLDEYADAGFKAWQQNFTWEKIAKQYEVLYKKLTNDHN